LRVAFFAGVELPGGRKFRDIAAMDLLEGRVTGSAGVAAIGGPGAVGCGRGRRGGDGDGDAHQRGQDGGAFHAPRNLRQKVPRENLVGLPAGASAKRCVSEYVDGDRGRRLLGWKSPSKQTCRQVTGPAHEMTRKQKVLVVLIALGVVLVVARLMMPYAVERYVNGKLQSLDSYRGHIGDVDIHLWRGAYSIDAIEIVKTGAARPVPFFKADRPNLSL
jgi:hypothetical protein